MPHWMWRANTEMAFIQNLALFFTSFYKPEDYEPPFFRCCSENEAPRKWTKNPLKMEVGNVNNKNFVLALKVKSVLDPCEDENGDLPEVEVNLGGDSAQDDSSSDKQLLEIMARSVHLVAEWGEPGLTVADGLSNLLKCRLLVAIRCLSHPSAHVRALSMSVLCDIMHSNPVKSSSSIYGERNGICTQPYRFLSFGTINWHAVNPTS